MKQIRLYFSTLTWTILVLLPPSSSGQEPPSADEGIDLLSPEQVPLWQPTSGFEQSPPWTLVDGKYFGHGSWVAYPEEFADFVFECEFLYDGFGQGGIVIRGDGRSRMPWRNGYELDIDGTRHPDLGHVHFPGRPDPYPGEERFKTGEWHKVTVEARGDTVRVWLDREFAIEFVDDQFRQGNICLEGPQGGVKYRNIRIRLVEVAGSREPSAVSADEQKMIMIELDQTWDEESQDFSRALSRSPAEVAALLAEIAADLGLRQQVDHDEIRWRDDRGRPTVMFFIVSDPRDLEAVAGAYQRTAEMECPLTYVFLQQLGEDPGNWDVFRISPEQRMQHNWRFWPLRRVQSEEKGPELREDINGLFWPEFPPPGRGAWADLLDESREKAVQQLAEVAKLHECTQTSAGAGLLWRNPDGELEAMFFVRPDPADLDAFVNIYEQIRSHKPPVTFVIVAQRPGLYDIFQLSAQSYLQHCNQAKRETR